MSCVCMPCKHTTARFVFTLDTTQVQIHNTGRLAIEVHELTADLLHSTAMDFHLMGPLVHGT